MNHYICKFNKKDISVGNKGILSINCSKDVENDLKKNAGVDIHSQKILHHILFATCDGKVSFTVPNRILQKQ